MPMSVPTQRLVVSFKLHHLVRIFPFVSFLLLFLRCHNSDASNIIYSSKTAVLPTSRPRQTMLSFTQGHLNIVKSRPTPRLGEHFSVKLHSKHYTTFVDMSSSVTSTADTDKSEKTNRPGGPGHTTSADFEMNATSTPASQVDGLVHTSLGSDVHRNCSSANETHVIANITTNEGNKKHCTTNEECLGDERMDNHSDHQNQGKSRIKISKNMT